MDESRNQVLELMFNLLGLITIVTCNTILQYNIFEYIVYRYI